MNKWDFSHETVRKVYEANVKAGIDIMEIGYRATPKIFDPKEYGPWRFCNEEDLVKITDGIETDMKLSMMVDIGRCEESDIVPFADSQIDIIRIACYAKEIDTAISLANHCIDKGYEVWVNIMAVSTVLESKLEECLKQIDTETTAKGVYLVDSFGSFDLEDITTMVKKYQTLCPSKEIGYHGHNNQQLGFANTVMAIMNGVNYLDASYYGMGRAAGNCPMELLMSFLKNPKFDLRPVLKMIDEVFEPLHRKLRWGYQIPYALAGVTNSHPKSSLEFMQDAKGKNFADYYDSLLDAKDDLA